MDIRQAKQFEIESYVMNISELIFGFWFLVYGSWFWLDGKNPDQKPKTRNQKLAQTKIALRERDLDIVLSK